MSAMRPTPPPKYVDVAVIGNGAIGMTIAIKLKLAAPNLHVAVIGPRARAGCATRAAGAMLGCYGEVTERTSTPLGHLRHEMAVAAGSLWADWLCLLNGRLAEVEKKEPLRPLTGTTVILNAASGEIDTRNYLAIRAAVGTLGHETPPNSLPLRPSPTQRPLCAYEIDGEGALNARVFLDALDHVAESLSIFRIDGFAAPSRKDSGDFVVAIRRTPNLSEKENEPDIIVRAEKLVLAAGAHTTDVLEALSPEIAARVPSVFPGIGQALLLDVTGVAEDGQLPPDKVLRTPNRAFACGLHVVPQGGRQLYVGATNFVGPEPEVSPYLVDLQFLMHCVMGQINTDLEGALLHPMLTGNRPVSLDTQPLIGRTSLEGVHICTGTYRDGIQVSPLLGDVVVADILGQTPVHALHSSILQTFAPERELHPWGSREESIQYAVEHLLADIAEGGTNLPWNRWDRRLEACLKAEVTRIVDAYSTPDWTLPPDFVPALFEHEEVGSRFGDTKPRSMRERVEKAVRKSRAPAPV